ncbi:MAG: DUF6163 family protein [Pseudomonadota bacterium]
MSIVLDTQVKATPRTGTAELIYLWFLRLMAGLCLLTTLAIWAGLSGISDAAGIAQLGSSPTAVAALDVCLAVLFPIAMLGLWLRTRWGVAIWLITLVSQILAHTLTANIFGEKSHVVVANTVALVAFALVAAFLFYRRKEMRDMMS